MRVTLLLVLLFDLSATWAQGVGGGADQGLQMRIIWDELRHLRDMVVEQKVELKNIEGRLRETEVQADEQKMELLLTKTSLEVLKRDHAAMEERLRVSEKQVEELKKVNTEQSEELSDLTARLGASEKQVEDLKKVNVELRLHLENQAAELLSIEARVTVSDSEMQLLTRKMDDFQVQNTAQEVELTSLMDRMNTTECRVDSLIKQRTKVAFYAALTNSGEVGPYNTPVVLKFSKVFTNIGNAYKPTTGFFTAPVKGVYYFRFTICGYPYKVGIGVQLFYNGKSIMFNVLGRFEYNENFEYLSNAVILKLNVGDELHLILPEREAIFDNENNHSTFTGFLLFNM